MTAPAPWPASFDDLLLRLRRGWKSVTLFAVLGAVAGAVAALLLPSYYQSGAAFEAEAPAMPQLTGALAGLASQLGGLQLGGGQANPQLFGDLITMDAVVRRVAQAKFPWKGDHVPLANIYGFENEPPVKRDYHTAERLKHALGTDVNIRTGVVRFNVEARTPELALALADTTLAVLNEANIRLRQSRASAEEQFSSARAAEAQKELADAEHALSLFYEHNRVTTAPALQLEEGRLRRQVDMAQDLYTQLRLQAAQAGMQAVRSTPAISVLDPPVLPARRSRPNRRLAVIMGLLIGAAMGVARLAVTRG